MSKISFLSIIFISLLLTSCGFHTPYKASDINADINSKKSNEFAVALQKHLNKDTPANYSINISDENKTQKSSSFDSAGNINSYTLNLNVKFEIRDIDNVLLLDDDLDASSHLTKMSSSQADKLQIDEAYSNLREQLIKKLLRIMYRLNEN
jgi:LPS-assembly lipoprotein